MWVLLLFGLVAFLCLGFGVYHWRRRRQAWQRYLVALPGFLLAGLLFAWMGYGLTLWLRLPDESHLAARLHRIAALADRSRVAAELTFQGCQPSLLKGAGVGQTAQFGVPWYAIENASSYIVTARLPIRPPFDEFFASYLTAVFLFDRDDHLITWTYSTATPLP